MEMIPLTAERKAQLDDYAQRHGQNTAAALEEVLANYPEAELQDHNETVDAVDDAYKDVGDGRTRPAAEFPEELREKHGLSRRDDPASRTRRERNSHGCCRNMPEKPGCDGL
jgi:hypothetical protein